MNTFQKVLICPNCAGYGMASESDGSYESELATCRRCNGSGRLLKTIAIEPFQPPAVQGPVPASLPDR